jgi:hypothetical protein
LRAGAAPLQRLIGRDAELEILADALEESCSGRARVYSLTGEAGVGKTRLAIALSSHARGRGAMVTWGRSSSCDVPHYWPWIQVIRECSRTQCNPHAAESSEIIQLLENGAGLTSAERFSLFDRIANLLCRVARSQPLVLVLDDVHAADEGSLLLLGFLARELSDASLLLLIVYRDAKAYLSSPTGLLLRDVTSRVTNRIPLRPLGRSGVAELVAESIGRAPEKELVEVIHGNTGGNPLLVEIALRNGLVDPQTETFKTIPEVLRPALESYLSSISSIARDLLAIASVVGSEFDFSVVQAVSGLKADEVLDGLAEAEAAGLLQRGKALAHYGFSHLLIYEALLHTLTGAHRARLHVRIGDALHMLRKCGVNVSFAEIAYHLVQGAAVGDAVPALEYIQHEADGLCERGAFEEAARFYDIALSILKYQPSNASRSCDLLLALAACQGRSGDEAGARLSFRRAGELARELGDTGRKALATLGQAQFAAFAGIPDRIMTGEKSLLWSEHLVSGTSIRPCADATLSSPPSDNQGSQAKDATAKRIFRQEGEYWTIAYGSKLVRLKDSKGLRYIAYLAANAGREFHVSDLATLDGHGSAEQPRVAAVGAGMQMGLSSPGTALDSAAKSSYRHRLLELREELETAKSFNDLGRVSKIEEEMEFLTREFARAVGLGGRDRRTGCDAERARLRITNAVRSALTKVMKQDADIGRYLANSVRTGSFCSFAPDGIGASK